jgi:hopanoid biosynthesis associated protein HpnK
LSEQVNAAVEDAHRRGILSATSLMVGAPAAADAVARSRKLPNLRVGLHVVLVDGDPIADRGQVPDLIDRHGRFRNDLAMYGSRIAFDPPVRRQVATEIAAQFEAYRATGLPLDHVNTHRHFHLHPAVAAAIMRIGPHYGMKALRVPIEPWRTVAAIDPLTSRWIGRVVVPWAKLLRARVRARGLATTDAVFGLAWSGAMTKDRVLALLGKLPAGSNEIYFHPAISGGFAGAAPGYRYADEFAALCDPDCVAAIGQAGFVLGGYSDLGA